MILLLGWVGCAGEGRPAMELATMDGWRQAAVADDPFPDHRKDATECPLGGVLVEGSTIEIDTGICNYVVLEQPLQAPVEAGDEVEIVFWHNDLAALEEAEAHVAFSVDGVLWLDLTVPIPSVAAAYAELITVPQAAAVGAPLVLHLHNHGANTWNVLRLTRQSDAR
ncbi:MAG: hypothetical protein AAGA48_04695 [Myxococcota bacterium]